ncbi:hypothetical protein PROFUN_07222, partial [Planoprotostelium fungivorum]
TPILGGLSASYPPFLSSSLNRQPLAEVQAPRTTEQDRLSARFMQQQQEALAEEHKQRQEKKMQKMLKKQARGKAETPVKGKEEAPVETKQRKRVRRKSPKKREPQVSQLNVVSLPTVIPNLSKVDGSALSTFLKEKGLNYSTSDSGVKTVGHRVVAVDASSPSKPNPLRAMTIDRIVDSNPSVHSPNIPIHNLHVNDSPTETKA